jgi:hypothetical protein
MTQHRFIGMLIGLGMMSACSERTTQAENDNGGDVALNVDSGNAGNAEAANSTTVAIDLPGLKGAFKLPKLKIASDDFDIDGVKLYPGSRVTGFEVAGQDGGSEGSVTLRFQADADPGRVQRYFLDSFQEKAVTARGDGTGIAGSDRDGRPFAIDLKPDRGGTRGVLTVGDTR